MGDLEINKKVKKLTHYRKPGRVGGALIRKVLATFSREERSVTSIDSHNLCIVATSGGADSLALAHLIATYGGKIRGGGPLVLVHFLHGWRGEESLRDASRVRAVARDLGARAVVLKPRQGISASGRAPEEVARTERLAAIERYAKKIKARWILTGHTLEDQAETVLWHLLTGRVPGKEPVGMPSKRGLWRRPLLACSRGLLRQYLIEESVGWGEDRTNFHGIDGVGLRAEVREEITPALDRLFPRWKEHFSKLATQSEMQFPLVNPKRRAPWGAGVRLKRSHLLALQAAIQTGVKALERGSMTQVTLPGGIRLLPPAKKS
jgi:tRNA(Ile)-lysidine synthetase-like protein